MVVLNKASLVACLVMVAGASFAAQSVVGKWNGKVSMQMPAAKSPQQQQQMEMAKSMFAKMVVHLTFKKDKSYEVTVTGVPGAEKAPKDTGKWSISGNTITMTNTSRKGTQKPATMTLSANGKTITMTPPNANGTKVIFSRA